MNRGASGGGTTVKTPGSPPARPPLDGRPRRKRGATQVFPRLGLGDAPRHLAVASGMGLCDDPDGRARGLLSVYIYVVDQLRR